MTEDRSITELLAEWSRGDERAYEALVPIVYNELRQLASAQVRGEVDATTPTSLAHDAFERLAKAQRVPWENRNHFFGVAAKVMRQALVDRARQRKARKRGDGVVSTGFPDGVEVAQEEGLDRVDLVALDVALEKLEQLDAKKTRIVELRFFAGLTLEETAEVLGLSTATVKREWAFTKLWLRREIDGR